MMSLGCGSSNGLTASQATQPCDRESGDPNGPDGRSLGHPCHGGGLSVTLGYSAYSC